MPPWSSASAQLAEIVMADPDVQTAYYWVGANPTVNSGRIMIDLKPISERTVERHRGPRPAAQEAASVPGIALFGQARQDVQIGAKVSKTQYQYTLQDPDVAELFKWAPIVLAKLSALPELQDVTGDLQASAPRMMLKIDRDVLGRLGITPQSIDDTLYDAFGQRQVATIFTQLDQHRVILEVEPRYQEDAAALDQPLCPLGRRPDGAAVGADPLRELGRAAHHQPPGPVSVGDAVVQSGARPLARRRALRRSRAWSGRSPGRRR